MDRENDNRRANNLWEKNGRRQSLLESERRNRRRRSQDTDRTEKNIGGSRYARQAESTESGTGSRQARQAERTENGSVSRYARQAERTESGVGSRYARQPERTESGIVSRYARQPERTKSGGGSRYADKQSRETAATQEKPQYDKNGRPAGKHQEKKTLPVGKKKTGEWIGNIIKERDPVKLALLSLGGVTAIAYIIVAIYFGGHFYSGTQVYGIDCGKKTANQVKQEVVSRIGEYALTVTERNDQQDVISAKQIGLQYEDDNRIETLLKRQNSFIWPIMMLIRKDTHLDVNTAYNREGIDGVIQQLSCMQPVNITAPKDAYRGETDEGYEVVAEVMGTTLDYEKTKTAIMDGLDRGVQTVSLEEAGCYIDPAVYQDDAALNEDVRKLNSMLTARITYDFSDRQEVVDAKVIRDWIFKDENGEYYIDDNHVWAYVASLAEKYDTFGGSRTFYTSIGTTVDLYGGDYGWAIDQDATAEILAADVKAGKTETIEPQYVYTAMSRDENDIGGTYVEICISQQEMWCYQDGYLVVDTPVVTGNPNKNNGTPSGGVWAIDAKMQDYTLRGEGYAAPVSYWMPFNGNVGIHDLQTRYYFGGSIYLSNGSHGCVNTPYNEAQTIYSIVSIGTPVIVYQ
ncbi:MAG: peptidoglycan binding domain-containing protein [Lachnospiraceae bacterium]|nr:peptidoglycan binding domain-containing protein [Lachnospiraceae bacterium]